MTKGEQLKALFKEVAAERHKEVFFKVELRGGAVATFKIPATGPEVDAFNRGSAKWCDHHAKNPPEVWVENGLVLVGGASPEYLSYIYLFQALSQDGVSHRDCLEMARDAPSQFMAIARAVLNRMNEVLEMGGGILAQELAEKKDGTPDNED